MRDFLLGLMRKAGLNDDPTPVFFCVHTFLCICFCRNSQVPSKEL